MKLRDRFRSFLRWSIDHIQGSAVETESESLAELSSRAVFPCDELLLARQKAARAKLPANSVRRLMEEQPTTFVRPEHVPEDYPIG